MTDTTEQERRRARRQQRILASAESRLNKITGTQSVIRETPSPSPSPSTSSTSIQKPENRPKAESIKSQKHRPIVQQLIEQEQANELNEKGFLGGKVPHLILASMLKKTSAKPRMSSNPVNKYWNVLHFVSMVWLGLLATQRLTSQRTLPNLFQAPTHTTQVVHYPVFWHFIVLESILYLGRLIYQPGYYDQAEQSGLNLSSQLPPVLQKPASVLSKYGAVVVKLYRDLFVVVFVIGFSMLCISVFQ